MPLMRCTEEAFIDAIKSSAKKISETIFFCKRKATVTDEYRENLNDSIYISRDTSQTLYEEKMRIKNKGKNWISER